MREGIIPAHPLQTLVCRSKDMGARLQRDKKHGRLILFAQRYK
jgi:hypothetical protein